MKFYMIYSNQYATGNKPIGIASLAATLKKAGHQFKLFDCTEFSVVRKGVFTDWNKTGEKSLQFMIAKNQDRLPKREKATYAQLIDKVITDINNYNPDLIGQEVNGLIVTSINDLPDLVMKHNISIAIVAVPVLQTQRVIDLVIDCGIESILNYAPTTPQVPAHVKITNIDPVISLQSMTYYLVN